jgi:hypothetical protein
MAFDQHLLRLEARFGLLPALAFSVDLVGRAACDAQS